MPLDTNLLPAPTSLPQDGVDPIIVVDDFFSYEKMKIRICNIIDSWTDLVEETKIRRSTRYTTLDIEAMRQSGDIQEDETFIPDRVIDTNINREKPDAMAFLKSSSRLAVFKCKSDPNIDTKNLEKEYTEGLTYKGWYREFDRSIDGAALHGWDSIEVVFDETKPLHIGFEHIGFDRLFFNRKVGNLQDCDILVRLYEVTALKLESFKTSFGFDAKQVDAILSKDKERRKVDEVETIYKIYFKRDNAVQVAWFSRVGDVNGWLKAPEQLRLGIKSKEIVQPSVEESLQSLVNSGQPIQPQTVWNDTPIDLYPIFLYLYKDDEQENLTEHKGRAFLDEPQQEASTAILTGFVNRLLRSSNVYGSPKTDDGESAEMKQLDVQLTHGGIYSKPIDFFSIDPPDAMVLSAMQYLSTLNAQNTGKTSYAVSNRKDSRKTATELDQAETKESELSSITIAGESEWLREIFDFGWRVVQSQAEQEKIKFLLVQVGQNPDGTMLYANDQKVISQIYDIRPAGDVDFVERKQEEQKFMQDWPVVQTTPLAQRFLIDYIRLRYPARSDQYVKIMEEGDKGKALVASLATLLQAFTDKGDLAALDPQQLQQLDMIKKETEAYLGGGQQQQGSQQVPAQ